MERHVDPSRLRTWLAGPRAWPVAIFVGFVALRIPFRSQFLVNWDAVNYALGMAQFDLIHHQPHPPGYIGYVFGARGLSALTGDANTTLTLISIVAGAVAPVALYVLARRLTSHRHGLAAAVLFGTAPLVWYYSSVAVSYIVGAAVALPLVWACHVARSERSERHLLIAAVLLAAMGALRQSDLVFLVPVIVYTAFAFPWRVRFRAAALSVVLSVPWLAGLAWAAGGPFEYLGLSADLAGLAGGNTWLFSENPVGVFQNVSIVAFGLLFGLSVGLLVVPVAMWYRVRPLKEMSSDDRWLLLTWALPALVTYVFVHAGQTGYVLVVLPVGFLVLARTTASVAAARAARRRSVPWAVYGKRRAVAGAVGLLVAVNAAGFVVLPRVSLGAVDEADDGAIDRVAESLEEITLFREQLRRYDLASSDRHWSVLTETVGSFDPQTTAVLALPTGRGSFRHLGYYLPEHRVYGVGFSLDESFGYLFRARHREPSYDVRSLEAADPLLPLPGEVRRVLVVDAPLISRVDPAAGGVVRTLADGSRMAVLDVLPGAALTFSGEPGRERIGVVQRGGPPRSVPLGRGR